MNRLYIALISALLITAGPASAKPTASNGDAPDHLLDCATHPTAFVCHKFSDARSVEQVWIDPDVACVPKAVYSDAEQAGQLTIGSRCGANSSGDFRFTFPPQTDQLWMQYRYKQERSFIDEPVKFGLPSPKIFVLWAGKASCSVHEFAHVNSYWRGYPQFYEHCGATPTVTKLPPHDFDNQPGGETRCHYQQPTERPGETCVFYRAEWATHTFHFDLSGAEHEGVSWVDGWIQYDNDRRYHVLSAELRHTRQLQSVYFSPYMTRKSNLVEHPQWKVWYQDILITRDPLISD